MSSPPSSRVVLTSSAPLPSSRHDSNVPGRSRADGLVKPAKPDTSDDASAQTQEQVEVQKTRDTPDLERAPDSPRSAESKQDDRPKRPDKPKPPPKPKTVVFMLPKNGTFDEKLQIFLLVPLLQLVRRCDCGRRIGRRTR